LARRGRAGQPAQGQNEQNARNQIEKGGDVCVDHFPDQPFFLYMPSMRWVTRKPPKIFTDAKTRAMKPKIREAQLASWARCTPTASSAPTTITEEMALVTLISGVCRAGVTLQTTK